VVDFLLAPAMHDQRDRFRELEEWAAVQRRESLTIELELDSRDRNAAQAYPG
jgi:hypothetical protein